MRCVETIVKATSGTGSRDYVEDVTMKLLRPLVCNHLERQWVVGGPEADVNQCTAK